MKNHLATVTLAACGMAFAAHQAVAAPTANAGDTASNAELQRLFEEDQSDRTPRDGKMPDWELISTRDEARQARVNELIKAAALHGGSDYYHAAMILQHGDEPDDYLLAHDLCVVALSKGEERAKWLAAASLDRFLRSIGRLQRFGTQYISKFSRPPTLAPVDPKVPDQLRREMNVPTLEDAKAKEAQLAKDFENARRAGSARPTNL